MIKKSNWTKEEDLEIIRLFKLGYTSRKIGEKLNRTKEAVQKRIQKLKKDYIISERERRLKQEENRDIRRAINRENNSFLSDRALVKSCMSVYKNNAIGDLVLDKEKAKKEGFTFATNMPGAIKNGEIRDFEKFKKTNKKSNEVFIFRSPSRKKDLRKEREI